MHIASIRADAARYASGGVAHLVLEVLAYAVDEAVDGSTRAIEVIVGDDGSIAVRDDGRWTARYVSGVPDGPPTALPSDGSTGTIVRFLPDPALFGAEAPDVRDLRSLLASISSPATVTVVDERRWRPPAEFPTNVATDGERLGLPGQPETLTVRPTGG